MTPLFTPLPNFRRRVLSSSCLSVLHPSVRPSVRSYAEDLWGELLSLECTQLTCGVNCPLVGCTPQVMMFKCVLLLLEGCWWCWLNHPTNFHGWTSVSVIFPLRSRNPTNSYGQETPQILSAKTPHKSGSILQLTSGFWTHSHPTH